MSRKLQAEIERVFKKVAEGMEVFEECYGKVLNATTSNQKEKYEADLKKEIKKLQRLRDQIKTWIQSNEIKDKSDLVNHRKLIEKQMEKFKAIEKEMKTKAYSKEGLLQSTKLDPKEREKIEICGWLSEQVDKLTTQIDLREAEAEQLMNSNKKKKKDGGKSDQIKEINHRVERHKYHVYCLERIQRLVENESLSPSEVEEIKEDVAYYVNENGNDDFFEDEGIYDDLDLDLGDESPFAPLGDEESSTGGTQAKLTSDSMSVTSASAPASPTLTAEKTPKVTNVSASEGSERQGQSDSTKTTASSEAQPQARVVLGVKTSQKTPQEPKNAWKEVKESVLSPSKVPSAAPPPPTSLPQPWAAVAGQNISATAAANTRMTSPPPPMASVPTINQAVSPVQRQLSTGIASTERTPSSSGRGTEDPSVRQSTPPSLLSLSASAPVPTSIPAPAAHRAATNPSQPKTIAPLSPTAQSPLPAEAVARVQTPTSPVGTRPNAKPASKAKTTPGIKSEFTLFEDLGMSDPFFGLAQTYLNAKRHFAFSAQSYSLRRKLLAMSGENIPVLSDQEPLKTYVCENPVKTPPYYPQTSMPFMEHPNVSSRMDLDTLFFAFYYQQNTYQQYLAAKELKNQSWRFHKKYLTWFQRFEEPREITDEYEQGTYIYFDYEGDWCQRKKSDFRFEYRYLEDTELV